MNEKVEQLQLCATLPGYLFVLANLSSIGDTVSLFCPKASVDYYTGMINFIGLKVANDQNEERPQYKLCVCANFQDADRFLIAEDSSIIPILLFPPKVVPEDLSSYADRILPYRANIIIVAELSQTVRQKEFYVALSKENRCFSQLKAGFLRYQLA